MFNEKLIRQLLLEKYNLNVSTVKYIDHSENILYKVVADSGRCFALKIHIFSSRADFEAFAPEIHCIQQLEKMMTFLQFLQQHQNIFLFKVPCPVRNNDGRYISQYIGIPFSLVTWCPGEDIEDMKYEKNIFFEIGKALANFHLQCKQYFPMCISIRTRYDTSYLNRIKDKLNQKISRISLQNEIVNNIDIGFNLLKQKIQLLEEHSLANSIIHGDISPSNIIYGDAGLYLIDFSFFGLGSIYQDLASLTFELSDKKKQTSIFAGYKTIFPYINLEYVRIYEIFRILLYIVANISTIQTFSWVSCDPLEWIDRLRQQT